MILVPFPTRLRQSKAESHVKYYKVCTYTKRSSHCHVTGMYPTVGTWNYSLALFSYTQKTTPHPSSVPRPLLAETPLAGSSDTERYCRKRMGLVCY